MTFLFKFSKGQSFTTVFPRTRVISFGDLALRGRKIGFKFHHVHYDIYSLFQGFIIRYQEPAKLHHERVLRSQLLRLFLVRRSQADHPFSGIRQGALAQ